MPPPSVKLLLLNSLDLRHGSTYRIRAFDELLRAGGYAPRYIEGHGGKTRRLLEALKESLSDFEILFTQKFNPVTLTAMAVARLRGKPVVVDWDDLERDMQSNRFKATLSGICEAVGPRLATVITTHSEIIRQRVVDPQTPVFLLHQGYDGNLFQPDPKRRYQLRQRLGYEEEDVVVGYMCTFTPGGAMDIDVVLEAFSQVKRPQARFILIGGGRLEPRIEESVKRLGLSDRTLITGLVPHEQVPGYLSALDLGVVYMSDSTANRARVSFKVLEYLASGVPVLGRLVGESERLFGHLITRVEPQQLARAVDRGVASPPQPPPRPVVSEYRWDRLADRLNEVLDAALSHRRP